MGNATVYLRGRFILDALFAALLPQTTGATDVVLKGCSAGGQAAFIHANHLAALFSNAGVARVSVMPGAGFFMDVVRMKTCVIEAMCSLFERDLFPFFAQASYPGPNVVRPFQESWFTLHNISGSLPPDCLANPPEGLDYLCAFPQNLLGFLAPDLNLFISQSLADEAQQGFIMNLGCDPSSQGGPHVCNSSQLLYLDSFRLQMLTALQPVLRSPTYGLFALECSIHVIEDNDGAWNAVMVEKQTQAETFSAWYSHGASARQVVDGVWGSNPTCSKYTQRTHSSLPRLSQLHGGA